MSQPLLKVTDLAKSFSGVWALSSAQLTVGAGEIHALLGENGAGKSTLLKALAGAQPQTRGEIWFNGETLPVDDSPVERQNKGIITIYQEFNLLPNMTVAENMFLGREPRKRNLIVDEKAVNQEAQVILDYLQLNVAPTTPVARLSVAQQQMVEIARALTLNARLIIMDEPSAALSDSEVESLHRVVRELKNRGVSIIYVTHRLHEVFQLCDRFTVFQDGRFTGTGAVAETNVEQLIRLMVGRDVAFNRRPASETHHEDKPVRLAVKGLSREKPPLDPHGIALHDISFHVHAGEVLGIAGLVGAGRTEVARCLFGADARPALCPRPGRGAGTGRPQKRGGGAGTVDSRQPVALLPLLAAAVALVREHPQRGRSDRVLPQGAADQNGQQRAGGAQALRR